MNIKRFVRLLALLLVAVGAVAQQTAPSQNGPSVAKLQQHVSYLASDALDGRRTGTAGATDAARYIAGEFARLGLRPAASGPATRRGSQVMARYLQSFPYVAEVELGAGNVMNFVGKSGFKGVEMLQVGKAWMPLGFSSNGKVVGSLVFAGYGITASEQNYDDYAGLNVKDNVVIALQGTPDGDNPHGQFARYDGIRWKAIAARNAGAKALVVVARENDFKNERLAKLTYDHTGGEAGIPVAVISRGAVDALLGTPTLDDWQATAKEKSQATKQPLTGQLTLFTDVVRKEVPAYNVIGVLEGSDRLLKNETIVIGAHYDHLGRGGNGSLAQRGLPR